MSEWCPLSEIADTNPETLPANTDRDYSFRYIDLGSVEAGHIDWHKVQYIRYGEAPSRARRRVAAGDVLFGTVRPNLQSHGYIDKTQKGELVASTGFSVVRARPAVSHGKYLFFALLGHDVYRQAVNAAVGSNYPAVNDSDVRRFKIFAPHVAEQKKIAQILDTLDTQIRQTEALIAKLEQLKQGLLTDLLSRGIDEHGQLRPPPEEAPHLYKDSRLGPIPREWDVVTIAAASQTYAGGTPSRSYAAYFGGGVPWVKSTEVNQPRISATEETITEDAIRNSSARWVPASTPLIAMYGATAGAVSWLEIDATTNQAVLALVPNRETSPRWLYWRMKLSSRDLLNSVQGSGQPNLSKDSVDKLAIPRPCSLPEQERVASALDQHDVLIANQRKELRKLADQKVGLMGDLLTGRVRVTPLLEHAEQVTD